MRLVGAADVRRLLTLLLIFVLLAAAVNVAFAVTRIHSRRSPKAPRVFDLRGADVGERTWPSSTPHEDPWPAPTMISLEREFGYSHYDARWQGADRSRNGFSMEVDHMGWPFPVIEDKQMWWDWSNGALEGPEPDPAPTLLPLGLVVNPLIVGGVSYLVLIGPVMAFVIVRRAWRRHGRQCVSCGYALADLDRCPECGATP